MSASLDSLANRLSTTAEVHEILPSAAYVITAGDLRHDALVDALSDWAGRPPVSPPEAGVNWVTLGVGALRSATRAALELHQEGYEEEGQLPEWLFLYCVESCAGSGQNVVAEAQRIVESADSAEIRFFRDTSQRWTPWRPVVERHESGSQYRLALPDTHRQVEVRGARCSVDDLVRAARGATREISLSKGDLLVVANRLALHGRREIIGARRSYLRAVI